MKIDPHKIPESQGQGQSQSVKKAQGVEQKDKTSEARKPAPADKVDISSRSKEIADIMSAVNQLPDVRDEKAQEIKQSIDAGTYTVDPRKVAEKILKEI